MAGGGESESSQFWERIKAHPQRWRGFLHEVRVEMRQVTWPSRHEVITTTFVVIVAVAFFGLFFFGTDTVASYLISQIFKVFGK